MPNSGCTARTETLTPKGQTALKAVEYYRNHPGYLPDYAPAVTDPYFAQWVSVHMPVPVELRRAERGDE